MKKVYIAHPFASDPETNRQKVDSICKNLKDVIPISPLHLFSFIEEETPQLRAEIMDVCLNLINMCDEIYVYGISKGTWKEAKHSIKTGKPISFMCKLSIFKRVYLWFAGMRPLN